MNIGYMRVSSEGDRQNLDLQRDALIKQGVDERNLFCDKGSGVSQNRSGLEKALDFLKPGDTLIVWKLDRLGRSVSNLISIIELLKQKNVKFHSITEGMNTSTPSGELLFNVIAALAQFEREIIKERVLAGLEAAKRRGKRGGRPKVIEKDKLKEIETALKSGVNIATACKLYGVKRTTLIRSLKEITNSDD